jgi:hypothetical protein
MSCPRGRGRLRGMNQLTPASSRPSSRLLATSIVTLVAALAPTAAAAPSATTLPPPIVPDNLPPAAAPAAPDAPVAPVVIPDPAEHERMTRARFSGTRLAVEILAGALIGSLAAYGTYESLCDGEDCLGASLAGYGVNFAITPLAVWGVGRAMGGDGGLGWTYLGGSVAAAPFSAPGSPDETPAETIQRVDLEFAISTVLLPVTSALMFELSSQLHYAQWSQAVERGDASLTLAPLRDRHGGLDGATAQLSLRF